MTPAAGQYSKKIFGKTSYVNPSNKTIMLVGATGCGKTTLINGMINYILGVDWEDNWRFKLIDEETNKSQAFSQTSEVTAYQIHHTDEFQVPYSLTIIDTPGFGDTKGINQDEDIKEGIRQFFKNKDGIDTIDAVCFVVQAVLARLTPSQKYIFRAILSIFGKNIVNNIITLVTFADGKSPPVLEAIKAAEIPCATQVDGIPVHFKFNNSALFADNTRGSSEEGSFDHIFWKMGKVNMNKFFTRLGTMETQSLTLPKQVLHERKQLEKNVQELHSLIQQRVSILAEIWQQQAVQENRHTHKNRTEENQDTESEDGQPLIVMITGGFRAMNCNKCKYTCHYPCPPRACSIIQNGQCTVCPGRCASDVHAKGNYKWESRDVAENQTLKRKYRGAMRDNVITEEIVPVQYEEVKQEVAQMIAKYLEGLRAITLQPDALSASDYIDLLITSENQAARTGFQDRIRELNVVRQSLFLANIAQGPSRESSQEDSLVYGML